MREHTNSARKSVRSEGREKKERFAFCIGIDLGDKSSDVCVLDSEGEWKKELRLSMKPAAVEAYFSRLPRNRVALEGHRIQERCRRPSEVPPDRAMDQC